MQTAGIDALEAKHAAEGGAGKGEYVQRIFSEIAPRYDLLNHLLSFNIDRRWRSAALRHLGWEQCPHGTYLDLCAGTLDVASLLAAQKGFRGHIIGADFAEPMLRAGRDKVPGAMLAPVAADAMSLPLVTGSIDGAIVAFGIRNVARLEDGLRETFRVLRGGARFVILEFTTPRSAVVRGAYHLYLHHVLPFIGGVVSGHRTAYRYLPRSVENFPDEQTLADLLRGAGFADVRWTSITFGVAAIHVATKPNA